MQTALNFANMHFRNHTNTTQMHAEDEIMVAIQYDDKGMVDSASTANTAGKMSYSATTQTSQPTTRTVSLTSKVTQ
jgi:hypothetical protein